MYPEFYSRRIIKKKLGTVHCEWCGQKVLSGGKAFYFAGKWEGDFGDGYMHMECHHASNKTDLSEGYAPHSFARGRTDDRKNLPPQFDEYGNEVSSP